MNSSTNKSKSKTKKETKTETENTKNKKNILLRASSIKEIHDPTLKKDIIIFIKNDKRKIFDDSFLNSSEIINFFSNSENDLNDDSFFIANKKQKLIEKKEKKEKISDFLLFKLDFIEPNCLILENDFCFEEILRTKLIQAKEIKYPSMSLTHLDNLKIPFPEINEEALIYKIYYKMEIDFKRIELFGKFEFINFQIKSKKREDLLDFVNNKQYENKLKENKILKKKLITLEDKFNLFVGINIKKINNDTYIITYNYAN
jgi:hypothetical protein